MTRNQWLELGPIGPEIPDGRLWDPISATAATMAGVSAGSSILGGIFGGRSASKAAKQLEEAARRAGEHVEGTVRAVNPRIQVAADNAGQNAVANAEQSRIMAAEAADRAARGVSGATTQANDLLNPYAEVGRSAATKLGATLDAPTLEQLQIDPGYEFRKKEALKSIQGSAAARGALTSGSTLKDIGTRVGEESSQEFQKAFDRFRSQRKDLFDITGFGSRVADTQGQNLIDSGKYGGNADIAATGFGVNLTQRAREYEGDAGMHGADLTAANEIEAAKAKGEYLTQGGNARAAGTIQRGNAISGLIGGVGRGINSAISFQQLMDLLKNPALTEGGRRRPLLIPGAGPSMDDAMVPA